MFGSMGQSAIKNLGNGGEMDGDVTITGDLEVQGGISLSVDEVIQGTSTIDVTNTEALLVRKNDDGGNVFVVDTTNKRVGINSTPSRTFQVDGTASATTATGYFYTNAIHTGVDTQSVVSIRSDNASSNGNVLHVQGDGTGNLLTLSKDGSDKLTVTHEGNVGIGVVPTHNLNVYNGSGSSGMTVGKYASGKTVALLGTSADTSGYFQIQSYASQGSTFGNIALNAQGGNVGIGTSSPASSIHAKSSASTLGTLERSTSGNALLEWKNTGDSWYAGIDSSQHFKISQNGDIASGTEFKLEDETGNATFGGRVAISSAFTASELLGVKGSGDAEWGARIENTSSTGYGALIKSASTSGSQLLLQVRGGSVNALTIGGDSNSTFAGNVALSGTTKGIDFSGSGKHIISGSGSGSYIEINNVGQITPNSNNGFSLGTSSARWSNTFTQLLNVAGNATFAGDITVPANKKITIGGQIGIGALNVKMADGSNQKRTINIVNADDQGWAFGTVTESNRVNFVLSKEYGDNSWSDALKVYNADGKFEFLGGGGATFAGNIELDHSNLIRFTGDTTTPTIGGDGSHLQFSAYSGIDHSVAVDSATFLFTSNQAGTTTTIYGGGGILTTGSITSDALLSNTSSTYDIGSSSNLWRDAYLKNGGRVYFGDTGTYVYGSSSLDVLTFAVGANERFKLDVNSRISLSNNNVSGATNNTVFGKLAGDDLESGGIQNSLFGENAGHALRTGDENALLGMDSGALLQNGSRNVAIGKSSANSHATFSDCVVIGQSAEVSANSASNQIVIGRSATGVANNSVTLGNADVTDVYMAQDSGANIHCADIYAYNQITIESADISSGENNGLKLVNTSGTDHTWHITNGQAGISNEFFTIRDSTNNRDIVVLETASGNATFYNKIILGGGITFPATQNASTNANTLDDYEEGTWSPTFHEGSNTLTFPSGTAVYTKIGNMVHLSYGLSDQTTSGTVSGTGQFQIRGLPFAPKAGIIHVGSVVEYSAITFAGAGDVYVVAAGDGSNTIINLYQRNDAQTLQNANITGVGANSYFSFQISYPV